MISSLDQLITGEDEDIKAMDKEIDLIWNTYLDWGKYTMEYLIRQIRTQHNYKLVQAAYVCNDLLKSAGEDMTNEILDALTFKVSFDGKLIDSDKDGTTTWSTKGEALVRMENVGVMQLIGEGAGLHIDYHTTDVVVVPFLLTKDFTFEAIVNFDPCDEKHAIVFIDKFGAERLTYKDDDGQVYNNEYSVFNLMWAYLEDNYVKKENMFAVIIDFESGNAVFDETMEGSEDTGKVSYTIKLEHSPQ